LGQRAAPVIRNALRGSGKHTRWEGRGVPLDRALCGLGEAGDPKPRANPANGNRSTVSGETLVGSLLLRMGLLLLFNWGKWL